MAKGATKAPCKDRKELMKKLILTGADIVEIGEEAELLVGGKNYNTAIISQVQGIRAPQFRAVSSIVFHKLLDETKVNAAQIRAAVDHEYNRTDWLSDEVNNDPEFIRHFVRKLAQHVRETAPEKATHIKLRTFINNVVEGFATSPEGIDQLRKRSVLVQVAIQSVDMPVETAEAVRSSYLDICREAGLEDVPVAVRSSAAGEDSRKKAFAGLQDTYLNMSGEDRVVEAYQWGLCLGLQPALHDLPPRSHPGRRAAGRTHRRRLHRRKSQERMGHREHLALGVHHAHDQSGHLWDGLLR